MAAIPVEEEDGKRPHRGAAWSPSIRGCQSNEGCLARLGIRGFKRTLQPAPSLLPTLRTPEGSPLPPNALAEMDRDLARLHFIEGQIREIETARLERLEQAPAEKSHAMVRLLARVIGIGVETADMLVREVLSRNLRDRRAVARYAGLTGAPDESGSKRREKGLARAGNARVRRGMIQLAWRFLMFQKESALAQCIAPARPMPPGHAEVADRRHGAQAANRIVAFRDDRRDAGWSRDAAGLKPARWTTLSEPRQRKRR